MCSSVIEILEKNDIKYTLKQHKSDVFTCEDAARERGVRLSQILKCMIGEDINGVVYVMLIPGDKTLKIKRVRHIAGGIKIDLIAPEELKQKFNLTVGAISPLQFINKAKFFVDKTVLNENTIDISSGMPDAGVELKTDDLLQLLQPVLCDIISQN